MKRKRFSEEEIVGIAKKCAMTLIEKKAVNVQLLDLKNINSYLDYFIISTANSYIHCGALAKEIQRSLKQIGIVCALKPQLDCGWIALDYHEIVIHVFTEELRAFYQLEKLWADADFLPID